MRKQRALWLLVGLILLGFGLRLYQIGSVPFRGDEAFNALYWAGSPLSESLTDIISREPFPPLGYIISRGWGLLFGIHSETTLRLLPALVNLLGIASIYALGKRLFNRQVGILTALLFAVHPYLIWHSQEFRLYGIWSGLSITSIWLAWRVTQAHRTGDWIAYMLVMLVSTLIFYFELITVGVLGLFVLLTQWRDWRFTLRWSLLNGGIIALSLLMFAIFQSELVASGGYGGTSGGADLRTVFTRFIPVLAFGDTLAPQVLDLLWIPVLLMLIVGLVIIARREWRVGLLLGMFAFVPLGLVSLIASLLITFDPRYALLALPAYILIFVGGVWYSTSNMRARRLIVGISIAIWLAISAYSLSNHYRADVFVKSQDWRELGAYLEANVLAGDVVVQTSVDSAFAYYFTSEADETSLPEYIRQPAEDITRKLESLAASYDSLWVVARPGRDWQNAGVVDDWLASHMQLTRNTIIDDLPARQFKTWAVSAEELTPHTQARFGDFVELVGARIYETPEPSGEITIWLYWRALQQTEAPLTIFMHLIGDTNPKNNTPVWTQSDWQPQRGRTPTTDWEVGRIYRDVFTLTVRDIPSGEYDIVIGFYDGQTLDRAITDQGTDSYTIGSVTLE